MPAPFYFTAAAITAATAIICHARFLLFAVLVSRSYFFNNSSSIFNRCSCVFNSLCAIVKECRAAVNSFLDLVKSFFAAFNSADSVRLFVSNPFNSNSITLKLFSSLLNSVSVIPAAKQPPQQTNAKKNSKATRPNFFVNFNHPRLEKTPP